MPSAAARVEFPDRSHFVEGVHWLFIDDPADFLWVSFNAAPQPPGKFHGYRSLSALPGKKLFIGDPENFYFQKQIPHILELLPQIIAQKNVRRCVFWGASMGAYGALLFGLLDIVESATYAFAPQFYLHHPMTPAHILIKDKTLILPEYDDLRPRIAKRGTKGINALLPCLHYHDGRQVEDLLAFPQRPDTFHVVATSHAALFDLKAAYGPEFIVDYFRTAMEARSLFVPERFRPSELDVRLSILSWHCMKYLSDGQERPDTNVDDRGSRNHGWFNAKLRLAHRERRLDDAIEAGCRSVDLQPHNTEYLICLGNALSDTNTPSGRALAEGIYREALRKRPGDTNLRAILRNNLARRGLTQEAEALRPPEP